MRVLSLLFPALFALTLSPAGAEELAGTPNFRPIAPALGEALRAVKAEEAVGIFLFVEPNEGPTAFASYLMRDHVALKRFVKKAEKDVKEARAISRWDKLVFLHLVGMGVEGAKSVKGKELSKKWVQRVQELTLSPSMNYQELLLKRGKR